MSEAFFTLPCRLVLPVPQRDRLERLCRARGQDINDVVSEIVLAFLDDLPDSELLLALAQAAQLALMLAQLLGPAAPPWLANYVSDLEREINLLWQQQQGDSAE